MRKNPRIVSLAVAVLAILVLGVAFGPRIINRYNLQFAPIPICDAPADGVVDGGTWSLLGTVPRTRGEYDATVLDGLIYQVGGFIANYEPVNYFDVYDPVQQSWRDIAAAPVGINHTGFIVLDGKIYMSGGFTGTNFKQADYNGFWVYDPAADSWTELAPMPANRAMHVMAAIEGIIYVASGLSSEDPLAVWAYDPATDTWDTSLAPLPEPARDHAGGLAIDGKLYVFGGRWLTEGNYDFVDAYDPVTDTWERMTSLPTARSGFRATQLNGKVHIISGQWVDGGCTYAVHEVYDPAADSWTRLADIPRPRHSAVTVSDGERIYFIAGSAGPGPRTVYTFSDAIDVFTPHPDSGL